MGRGRVGGWSARFWLGFGRAATKRWELLGASWRGRAGVRLGFNRAATKRWPVGRGRAGGWSARFRLGHRRIVVEHEWFLVLWVMRVFLGWGIIGVRTGIWIPYRSRVGVSRLSQASGRLAPLAGSETTRPALGSGGAQPGARMVCPTCYRDSLPGRESQKDGLGTVEREIARKGSPQPEAVPRTRHTHPTDTLMERAHRERPLAPVSSTQSAAGSWQIAVGSTQYRKEVTPHMHTPATTHPQHGHAQRTAATTLALGEPTRPANPRPASPAEPAPAPGPAPAPAPAPARPWTPDGPARRTNSTTAAAASTVAAAVAVVVNAQARQPRQPRPRQHTPTPATPATVAASLNPDRHGARPGNTTAKTRHRTVAAACSPTQTNLAPASDLGQPLASSSLTPVARLKTGPAPASDLGQPLASSSLTPVARPKTSPAPACDLGQPLASSSLTG